MTIKNVRGHFEVYDGDRFMFSVDNDQELKEELQELEKAI